MATVILAISLGCLLISLWLTNISLTDSRFIFSILSLSLAILGIILNVLNVCLRAQHNLSGNKAIDFIIIVLYVVFATLLVIDSNRRKKAIKEMNRVFAELYSVETVHSRLDSLERSFLLIKNAIDVDKCVLAPKLRDLDIYKQFVSDTSSIIESFKTADYSDDIEQGYRVLLLYFVNTQINLFKSILDYITSSEGKDLNKTIDLLTKSLNIFKEAVNQLSDFKEITKER